MSYPTIPDAKVLEEITAILHKNASDPLAPEYAEIVAAANRLAIADIYRIMISRGYSGSQIASWDDVGRYNLDQAVYWALMRAPGFGAYPDNFVKQFDRRKELLELPAIIIGGDAVVPGPSDVGGITSGRLKKWRRFGDKYERALGNFWN